VKTPKISFFGGVRLLTLIEKIESPVKGVRLKFLDAETLLDRQEKSFGLFEQIILKGAGR